MPNKKKKKYNARFPPARIKKIMQKDEEVGKVAAAVPVIISRALELFVESLIRKSSEVTQARNAKTLTSTHLKHCILNENQFDFLKDLVATVPDVQGEDDSSNPLPPSSSDATASKPTVPRMKRQRMARTRKYGGLNAGPSQTGTEEDSEDEDEDSDEEDEDDVDDEDGSRSEDSLPSTRLPYFNHQGFTGHMYGKPSPNGVPLQPASETTNKNLFGAISVSKLAASTLDEDYDS